MPKLIVITGHSGAGKSTLAKQLSQARRVPIVNLGDVVWQAVLNLGLRPTSRAQAGVLFSEEVGLGSLSSLALSALPRDAGEIIVDGLRIPQTLKALNLAGFSSEHIHVDTPLDICFERQQERDRFMHEDFFFEELQFLRRHSTLVLPGYALSNDRSLTPAVRLDQYRVCASAKMPQAIMLPSNWR